MKFIPENFVVKTTAVQDNTEFPRWCNGWRACQVLRVQARPSQWVVKGDKNPQHDFLRMGSEAGGPMS
jgi:hypothetical protein